MPQSLGVAAAAVLSLGILLGAPSAVEAQAQFGPKVSLASDNVDFGIGFRVLTPIGNWFDQADGFASQLEGHADIDFFFPDCGTACQFDLWQLAAGVRYPFVAESTVKPYAGAGLVYSNVSFDRPTGGVDSPFGSSDSEFGLNLLGGIDFDLGSLDAFAEARIEIGGTELFVVSGGLKFGG